MPDGAPLSRRFRAASCYQGVSESTSDTEAPPAPATGSKVSISLSQIRPRRVAGTVTSSGPHEALISMRKSSSIIGLPSGLTGDDHPWGVRTADVWSATLQEVLIWCTLPGCPHPGGCHR